MYFFLFDEMIAHYFISNLLSKYGERFCSRDLWIRLNNTVRCNCRDSEFKNEKKTRFHIREWIVWKFHTTKALKSHKIEERNQQRDMKARVKTAQ